MNDLRISFEYEFRKYGNPPNFLNWDDQFDCYIRPDVQLAYKWYCRGFINGEKG